MSNASVIFAVSLAAGFGAIARATLSQVVRARVSNPRLPWGTLAANIAGSFLLGALLGGASGAQPKWLIILGTGFCGGFTTFSTFTWESLTYLRSGQRRRVFWYAAITLVGGIGAFLMGHALVAAWT